jgi:hypothetical protein
MPAAVKNQEIARMPEFTGVRQVQSRRVKELAAMERTIRFFHALQLFNPSTLLPMWNQRDAPNEYSRTTLYNISFYNRMGYSFGG